MKEREACMRASMILIGVVLLTPGAADAQIAIRPGQYEYTLVTKMAGAQEAAGSRERKRLECITADEANQAKTDVAKFLAQEMQTQNCKMSDVKIAGNKLSYTSTCVEDSLKIVMSTETTFAADSFSSISTVKSDAGPPSTTTMSARRVGECK
jgi:hypothetical protein